MRGHCHTVEKNGAPMHAPSARKSKPRLDHTHVGHVRVGHVITQSVTWSLACERHAVNVGLVGAVESLESSRSYLDRELRLLFSGLEHCGERDA